MDVIAEGVKAPADEETEAPWRLTIPDIKDVIVGELAEPGDWIVAKPAAFGRRACRRSSIEAKRSGSDPQLYLHACRS